MEGWSSTVAVGLVVDPHPCPFPEWWSKIAPEIPPSLPCQAPIPTCEYFGRRGVHVAHIVTHMELGHLPPHPQFCLTISITGRLRINAVPLDVGGSCRKEPSSPPVVESLVGDNSSANQRIYVVGPSHRLVILDAEDGPVGWAGGVSVVGITTGATPLASPAVASCGLADCLPGHALLGRDWEAGHWELLCAHQVNESEYKESQRDCLHALIIPHSFLSHFNAS